MTDLGSKKPLQLAHFVYEDAKICGTKVWGGSLDFNIYGILHCTECNLRIYKTLKKLS